MFCHQPPGLIRDTTLLSIYQFFLLRVNSGTAAPGKHLHKKQPLYLRCIMYTAQYLARNGIQPYTAGDAAGNRHMNKKTIVLSEHTYRYIFWQIKRELTYLHYGSFPSEY